MYYGRTLEDMSNPIGQFITEVNGLLFVLGMELKTKLNQNKFIDRYDIEQICASISKLETYTIQTEFVKREFMLSLKRFSRDMESNKIKKIQNIDKKLQEIESEILQTELIKYNLMARNIVNMNKKGKLSNATQVCDAKIGKLKELKIKLLKYKSKVEEVRPNASYKEVKMFYKDIRSGVEYMTTNSIR